jgi:phosphoethanolamine N-methyltransferase
MKEYWVKHSQFANIQEMLLDSNAQEISENELPEILSHLPSIKAKKILELGAGIGRFTRVLAQQAEKVTAVDFIEKFVLKNQELNADVNNIDYLTSDVTKLQFEKNSLVLFRFRPNFC